MTITMAALRQKLGLAMQNETHTAYLRRQAVIVASASRDFISHVPRVGPLDVGVFRALAGGGVPMVLVGMLDAWPISKMSRSQLVQEFGHVPVKARVGDYVSTAFSEKRTLQAMTLAEYFSDIHQHSAGLPAYLGNQVIPELDVLCHWPAYFEKSTAPRVWLGPAGTVTPLHCDYDDNLLAQVWGRKQLVLYPPHHAPYLNPRECNPVLFASDWNPEAPDLGAMPLARYATPIQCVLKAGEVLFLPAGWFHHVRALDFSLSINLWSKDIPFSVHHLMSWVRQ